MGRSTDSEGIVYLGQWKDDKFHGLGEMSGVNLYKQIKSSKYKGQFVNGKRHGLGITYSLRDEPIYGVWKKNKF